MAKDPALLFYTSDFLTGTLTMSDEQVGKYIRLLCLQHQRKLLSHKDMLNICKSYDKDVFDKFVKNEDGFYYNERLDVEAKRRTAYCSSRSKNRLSVTENVEEIQKDDKTTYVKHMETETILSNNIIIRTENFKKSIYPFAKKEGGIYEPETLKAFFEYWSEPNKSNTKMKFELQKTWDLNRRIKRWSDNDFGVKKTDTPKVIDTRGNAGETYMEMFGGK